MLTCTIKVPQLCLVNENTLELLLNYYRITKIKSGNLNLIKRSINVTINLKISLIKSFHKIEEILMILKYSDCSWNYSLWSYA